MQKMVILSIPSINYRMPLILPRFPEDILVVQFHGSKSKREKDLDTLIRTQIGLCITTYGVCFNSMDLLCN